MRRRARDSVSRFRRRLQAPGQSAPPPAPPRTAPLAVSACAPTRTCGAPGFPGKSNDSGEESMARPDPYSWRILTDPCR
eukprot:4250695-Pyramimonas_sp.AAC.1